MRIAIAVTVQDGKVEDILFYKEFCPFGGGHNFDLACEVAEENDQIDGDPIDSDYKKPMRCRTYPLVDGEIHVEEVEV